MWRSIPILLVLQLIVAVNTSCTGGWGYYSDADRERAHANELPYWEDVFQYCFPKNLEDKTIDRYKIPKFIFKKNPPQVIYYDSQGNVIRGDGTNAPARFDGYEAIVLYYRSAADEDDLPLGLFICHSKPVIAQYSEPRIQYIEIQQLGLGGSTVIHRAEFNNTQAIEKTYYDVGAFRVKKEMYSDKAVLYAQYEDYFCIVCPIFRLHTGQLELFEILLSQIDMECIKGQRW